MIAGNDRSQAALMILAAGESAGGPDNRHRGADQWLYVIGGEGEAIVWRGSRFRSARASCS